jgi:hypothetical protein
VAGINVEILIDPELRLPNKLEPDPMHGVVRHQSEVTSSKLTRTAAKKSKKKTPKRASR